MKTLLFLFVIFTSPIVLGQEQPTKEETIAWLNSKTPNNTQFNDKNVQRTALYGRLNSGTEWKIEENFAAYSLIKSINYTAAKEKTDLHKIILLGIFEQKHKESPGDNAKISEIKNFEITFSSSVPETEIQKIVKAIKHLATLEGAKFLKEHLFD